VKRTTRRVYKKASSRFRRVTYTTAPDGVEVLDDIAFNKQLSAQSYFVERRTVRMPIKPRKCIVLNLTKLREVLGEDILSDTKEDLAIGA
jgi:hypothetical protein